MGSLPGKTARAYKKRGPHFLKCACPGCQNFFAAVKPYSSELAAAAAPFGVDWTKPDGIEVLFAEGERLVYKITYGFFGRKISFPEGWITEENGLGSINFRNPGALYHINEVMTMSFEQRGKRLVLEVRAVLPWVMETMNCIYDSKTERPEKKLPSRPERIYRAVKHIAEVIRSDKQADKRNDSL